MGSAGMIPPHDGYLRRLRAETERRGALLVMDEVISLRVASGGAQDLYGVTPDLTAMGKIIGGGFSVGAFGGRREIMADVPVKAVMTRPVVTAAPEEDIHVALERMREHGVRRLPILNEAGLLAGMVTLDDILLHVARSMRHARGALPRRLRESSRRASSRSLRRSRRRAPRKGSSAPTSTRRRLLEPTPKAVPHACRCSPTSRLFRGARNT